VSTMHSWQRPSAVSHSPLVTSQARDSGAMSLYAAQGICSGITAPVGHFGSGQDLVFSSHGHPMQSHIWWAVPEQCGGVCAWMYERHQHASSSNRNPIIRRMHLRVMGGVLSLNRKDRCDSSRCHYQ